MFQLLAPSWKGLKFLWKTVYNFEFCKITDLKQLIYSWSIQKEFFTGALRKCSKILKNSQIHIFCSKNSYNFKKKFWKEQIPKTAMALLIFFETAELRCCQFFQIRKLFKEIRYVIKPWPCLIGWIWWYLWHFAIQLDKITIC